MKNPLILSFMIAMIYSSCASGQVPIYYYDFEGGNTFGTNTNRNTTAQTNAEAKVSTVADVAITNSIGLSATLVSNSGNGFNYGSNAAGVATSTSGFTTNASSSGTDNSLNFSAFDCTGFKNITISLDARRADINAAQNIDIYTSTNNITYTKATFNGNAVTTSYSSLIFSLPSGTDPNSVDGTATLYVKVIGYKAVTSGGILNIDNFTVYGDTYIGLHNITLICARTHGQGLSSGGTYFPTYTNFSINNNFALYAVTTKSIKFNGTLAIVNGNFQLDTSAVALDTLTFNDANTPITMGQGSLGLNNNSSLVFGEVGHVGGSAFTMPNYLLAAPVIGSLTVNRTNSLALGNQNLLQSSVGTLLITGDLTLTSGVLNDNGNKIIIRGNILGNGSHASTASGKLVMTGIAGKTLPGLTYGNIEFDNIGGFTFIGSPTINGTITLTTGALILGSNTLTLQNANIPISVTLGSLTTTSASSLIFGTTGNTGGTAFTIPNNAFTTIPVLNNLTINRTNPLTLNNQNISLRGLLAIKAGTLSLPTNYIFTLKSTSITNTAMVDVVGVTGGISYASGAVFLVERFIPQGKRSYRFLSPSVNSGSSTIFTNWQEGGDTTSIYGIKITGKIGTPNAIDAITGFDLTKTGNQSLYVFNPATETYNAYTHTNLSSDTLSAFRGYLMTIRGNRQQNLSSDVATMNADVFLRTKGKLVTGDVTMTTSGTTANGATNSGIKLNSVNANGVTLIGNPYAAPISWDNISANSTGLEQNYYAWDPTIATSGAYVAYNVTTGLSNPDGGSVVNKYIQPGQSFLFQTRVALMLSWL